LLIGVAADLAPFGISCARRPEADSGVSAHLRLCAEFPQTYFKTNSGRSPQTVFCGVVKISQLSSRVLRGMK